MSEDERMKANRWHIAKSPRDVVRVKWDDTNHRSTRGARAARARELGGVPLFRDTMNAFFKATRKP